MRPKTLIPLVIGAVFGFVAIKLSIDAVRRAQASPAKTKTVQVVISNADIEATTELVKEMLLVQETPATPLVPSDAFVKLEDIVGRVAAKSIPRGVPILPNMLAAPGAQPGISVKIEPGYRACSVKIDEVTGVAYNIRPGDFVDVIAVMSVVRNQKKETISNVLLQRVQVAGVGQLLDEPADGGKKKTTSVRSMTLLVREQEAAKLHLAQTKGKITLAMRGKDDESLSTFDPATENALTGGIGELVAQTSEPGAGSALASPLRSALDLASLDGDSGLPAQKEWWVTVFNGPLKAKDATAVHRVAYEHNQSWKVLRTENGRAPGKGDPDSAESLTQYKPEPTTDRRDRGRGGLDRPDEFDPSTEPSDMQDNFSSSSGNE